VPEDYMQSYFDFLYGLSPITAVGMVAVSCIFLTQGWKWYKILITVDALILGISLGADLGARLERPYMDVFVGIGGGLVFAALAWPLMKGAVCIMGAITGAAIGYVLWRYAAHACGYLTLAERAWAGGVIGMVTMGLLTFIIFRTTVIIVLALQGAALLVSGVCALMFRVEGLQMPLLDRMHENIFLLPLMVLVPGLLGIIFQENQFLQVCAKKRKAAMKGG